LTSAAISPYREVQAKLLRVLERGWFERWASNEARRMEYLIYQETPDISEIRTFLKYHALIVAFTEISMFTAS
jgi:hypothetical protein